VSDWTLLRGEPLPVGLEGDGPESCRLCLEWLLPGLTAASSLSEESLSSTGLLMLEVETFGEMEFPGIFDLSELLIDLDEPWVSDLENDGKDSSFGPDPVGVVLLLLPSESPSLDG
jgi:hypothetical protein